VPPPQSQLEAEVVVVVAVVAVALRFFRCTLVNEERGAVRVHPRA
jgi:hypothetical protein